MHLTKQYWSLPPINLLLKSLICGSLLCNYGASVAQGCDVEIQKAAKLSNPNVDTGVLEFFRDKCRSAQISYKDTSLSDLLRNEKITLAEIERLQGRPSFEPIMIVWACLLRKEIINRQATVDKSAIGDNCAAAQPRPERSQQSAQQNQTTQQQSQQSPQQNQQALQQSQQAQQQAQQAQDAARVAQTRADQARQGQRRRHEPENEASHCIQPDFGGLYGGMKNSCNFKVWYTYCGFRPKENSWLTGMSCEKQSFGSDSVSPGRTSASHTKGVESIHWIACKEPAWTVDTEFVPGQGIKGRCHTVGGK